MKNDDHASFGHKIKMLVAVVVPFLALIFGIIQVWGWGIDLVGLSLLVGFYIVTGLGITVGFHRLFTHASFKLVRPVKIAFAILGSMAIEGPLDTWVARHNKHHRHSDEDEDPHSPLHGFWHAHMLFMFSEEHHDKDKYAKHILADPDLRWISKMFPLWVFLSLALPALIGGLVTLSWFGAFQGFLWGGLIRIFFLHHVTWSINSVCHTFGTRRFRTQDQSRNNWIFGILGGGEGWHHNHHALPTSARHGLYWWEVDYSYWVIKLLEKLRLASNVNVPTREIIEAKRIRS